jgi:hypothetical protein
MLDVQTSPEVPDLVPARMLNEFTYCARLAYLEWAQCDFADSADTVEGRFHHRKVDKESGELPPADHLSEAAVAEKYALHGPRAFGERRADAYREA